MEKIAITSQYDIEARKKMAKEIAGIKEQWIVSDRAGQFGEESLCLREVLNRNWSRGKLGYEGFSSVPRLTGWSFQRLICVPLI